MGKGILKTEMVILLDLAMKVHRLRIRTERLIYPLMNFIEFQHPTPGVVEKAWIIRSVVH